MNFTCFVFQPAPLGSGPVLATEIIANLLNKYDPRVRPAGISGELLVLLFFFHFTSIKICRN